MKKKMNRLGRFACMLTWMMLTALVAWGQTAMTSQTVTRSISWSGQYSVSGDVTIKAEDNVNPLVRLAGNTTINIPAGATLTVKGRIDLYGEGDSAGDHTLTITGGGTLIVETSSSSGCISGGTSIEPSGSLFIENASVTLRYTGNSSVTSAVSGLNAITLNDGSFYATIAESAVENETPVLVCGAITLNGGEFYTNGLANNSSQTFTIADGKYYKDETTGKRYKGELTIDDKEEIQGHNLVETTDEFYYLTATENDNVTEIWTYIGFGNDTSLPEKRIDVSPDASVALSIEAKLGYKVTGVTVKDSDNLDVSLNYNSDSDEWEFIMPQKDVNVIIETGEANYPELPLTWNDTKTEGTGNFNIVYTIYTFTPTQDGYYKFTTDKTSDVDVYVFDTDSDLTPTLQGYALEANKIYYVNINPKAGYDTGSFTLTVTVEGPTAMEVIAHKASYNGVPKYWATFYHPLFNYQLPEGAMAFYMKSDHALYLVGDDGSIIPKKTPVVIMADVSTEDTVSLSLSPVAATDVTVTDNVLQGTAAAKTLESGETVYVMGKPEDNLGFYKYTGTEIPANKAYYKE